MTSRTVRVLIVAGSDSGGGAGIQADIKTVTMLGGHAMTAITAITAQNTLGVEAIFPLSPELVVQQMAAVAEDIGVDVVKIGMLGGASIANGVADALASGLYGAKLVLDPVMIATSGAALADTATIAAMDRLARLSTIVTPNLPELAALCGLETIADADIEAEATEYAVRIGAAVLVKGGHGEGDVVEDRLVMADGTVTRWADARIDTKHTHGTGCTLASAIADGLGRGLALPDAVARARLFVRMALHGAPGLGGGHGPMGHQTVRLDCDPGGPVSNQVTLPMDDHAASRAFYTRLGLVPIVEAYPRYARFESAGGTTLSIEARGEMAAGPMIYFECGDLDGVVARMRSGGVAVSGPRDEPWGWREARLTDPAGNAVCLYRAGETRRHPAWRVSRAGSA